MSRVGGAGGRITLHDVARAARVSYGTVSRVLNGGRGVSAPTRRAVEQAISRIGYVPNHHARRLAGVRPDSVAFLHCVAVEHLFADPNINGLSQACQQALGGHGIAMVTPVGVGDSADAATRRMAARLADPVLLFSAPKSSPAVRDLVDRDVPVVACGTPLGHERTVSYVATDDRDGARQIVSYLRSRGRRRIAMITGPMRLPGGVQRLAGYHDAVPDADPALVAPGDYTYAGGVAAAEVLLRRAPDLDAVFAASDLMAAGALAALRQAGRRVPGDVAVAGFDDGPIATGTRPQLTTVRTPRQRHPGELVRQVLRRLDGDDPTGVLMPVDLVIRGSA